MSLLAPWFLLGGLLIGLPLWLHRLQSQSAERKTFSSSMLLESAEQRVHVRKQLKYKLLLAARIALLLIIAFTFAKPLLMRPASVLTATDAGTHLVVIDASASMSRRYVFAEAQTLAKAAIDSAPTGALLQVVDAASDLAVRSELSADHALHRSAIDDLEPSAQRADFGRVVAAADSLAELLPEPVTLHIVSDFQESGLPVHFADLVPENVATLVLHQTGSNAADNLSIDAVQQTRNGIDVSVSGISDLSGTTNVELLLNNEPVRVRSISDAAAAVVTFDNLVFEDGDNRLALRIDAVDDLAVDNVWYQVIEQRPPSPLPLISSNHSNLPVVYLTAALQSDRASAYQIEALQIGQFDPRVLSRYRWAVVDDLGSVDTNLATDIGRYIENGGNVLAFIGQRSAALQQVPVGGHAIGAATTIPTTDTFLSIGQIDAAHPLLAQTDGWHDVNVSQALPVETTLDDQVLIRLENGQPLLIEQRRGLGRLLIVNGGLENRWNDLPVRPVFVSFVVEAAKYLSGAGSVTKSFDAGAAMPLALTQGASGQVIDPDGNNLLSLADTTRVQQIRLNQPGFYEVYTHQDNYIVAVNADARESDTRTMSVAAMQRWRDAVGGEAAGVTASDAVAITTQRPLELWHAMLIALLIILLGESLLGNNYLSRRTVD